MILARELKKPVEDMVLRDTKVRERHFIKGGGGGGSILIQGS